MHSILVKSQQVKKFKMALFFKTYYRSDISFFVG